MADADSHAQYSGDIMAGLDASKATWGVLNDTGNSLEQG